MSKKKKIIGVVCGVVAVAVVGGYLLLNQNSGAAVMVSTETLQQMDLQNTVSLTGVVESETDRKVYSTLSYLVESVNVQVGDVVQAGDVLAQLDTEQLEMDIAQQQAAVDASNSQSAHQIEVNRKAYENAVENYENGLDSNAISAESGVNQAESSLTQAEYGVDSAQLQVDKGAAFATVISQFISALWTLRFLTGKKTILKIKKQYLSLKVKYVTKIISLGMAGFMMAITNSIVTIVCNATLQQYGGDLYIAIMTIINSIREVASLPGQGMANACQPVLGFNYGAKEYARVLQGIKFVTLTALSMMLIVWLAITVFPELFIKIFSHNQEIITHGVSALRLYFFGFFMMSFQMTGQAAAVGLGKSKQAVFFSIFRKVIIVAPLTVILPIYIGIDGVFIAEAISNFIGGGACYITMWFTIAKKLKSGIISE